MITDSFGSPSLGQGIALQAQPKDYSGQIVKGIVAGQERKAKAEQKKLDADLKKQIEEDDALSKFKLPEGRFRAFDRERLSLTKQWYDKVIELKNNQKPIKNNTELKQLEWELQNKFDKIRELEDRYAKGYDQIATPGNKDRIKPLEEKIKALDNEQEYLKLSGGDIYNSIGNLYDITPEYNYLAKSKKIGDNLSAQITTSIDPAVIGKMDGAKKTQTEAYLRNQVNEAWNMLKLEPDYQYQIQQAIATNPNLKVDEYEKTLETVFKSRFNDKITEAFQQSYEKDDGLGGAGGGLGTTDWNFQSQKDDNDSKNLTAVVNNEQLATFVAQPNTKSILDFIEKYKTSTSNRHIIDRSDISQVDKAIKDFEALIDNDNKDALSLAKQMYGSGFTKDIPISKAPPRAALKGKSEELYFSPRGKESKTFSVISYNGEKLDNAVILSYGRVFDSTGKAHKFFKVKVPNKRGGEEMYVPADETSYGKENRNTIGTPIGVSADRFDEALDKYYTAGTKPTKFENGGEIQPKEISKRFHDKSRNMTKFVYSDGSEEIFKGLL